MPGSARPDAALPPRASHPLLLHALPFVLLTMMASASVAQNGGDCDEIYGEGPRHVQVATGSPGELGLLRELALGFHRQRGIGVCWRKAGSGQALAWLRAGAVDAVLVHAPAEEKQAVAEGWAAGRVLIGGNEYYLVGPPGDPAAVAQAESAAAALRRIAAAAAPFVSRADRSGTHLRELQLWAAAGVQPGGSWYIKSPGFMSDGLRRAESLQAYFLTDSSTWLSLAPEMPGLRRLFSGDPVLVNRYHGLAGTGAGAAAAQDFLAWIAGPEGQQVIAAFGADSGGEPWYLPAARLPPSD